MIYEKDTWYWLTFKDSSKVTMPVYFNVDGVFRLEVDNYLNVDDFESIFLGEQGKLDKAVMPPSIVAQSKLELAQKVFDAFVEDGYYGPHVLGEDLWVEFESVFTKDKG